MPVKPSSGLIAISIPLTTDPMYLRQPAIANLVEASIYYGSQQLRYYDLEAYVVMANHVHLLITPKTQPSRLLQTLKGYTAREGNRILQRTREPFWQAESYDHSVRDNRELERIRAYIENNPVKAGLVARPEDYRWTSARKPR